MTRTTHGIDLAVQPANTAWASIDWPDKGPAKLHIKQASTDGRADNPNVAAWLSQAAAAGERVGIDVPLGWPDGFGQMVQQHATLEYRPPAEGDWEETYAGMRLRKTDEHVTEHFRDLGKSVRPLSVSADKLGATAMRAAWLLGTLARMHPVDRTGVSGPVVEMYPAAALAAWNLPHSGYKSGDNAKARQHEIWEGLRGIFADPDQPANDHQLDAVVAAIVAYLADGDSGPERDLHEIACREGWIHLPPCDSLERLFGDAQS